MRQPKGGRGAIGEEGEVQESEGATVVQDVGVGKAPEQLLTPHTRQEFPNIVGRVRAHHAGAEEVGQVASIV